MVIRRETRPYNAIKRIKFLSVQYRISIPNGWTRLWRQESKRHLDWSVWAVPERWSGNNESCGRYGVYADGNFGLFLSNSGNQVTLPLSTERIKTLPHGLKHTAFVNSNTGAKVTYVSPVKRLSLPYFLFCLVICVMWSDIPFEETCLRYWRTSPHHWNMPAVYPDYSRNTLFFRIVCVVD